MHCFDQIVTSCEHHATIRPLVCTRHHTMTAKAPEILQRPLADFTGSPDDPDAADEVLQRIMLDYPERCFT